ncbi:NAD(P)-dependent oxidoreductase [Aliiruegeria lutimaris]|uniref:3-hydroxyisobutyrate dehydrogenase n=1 Tax=Aliiruegeria lutimaris TaxID=571298 RepID=A0A1G8XEH0_9RHOB|nr:NAD(P)-binding domain-containing protein [Aliiruegeria lutimaris]SDJ88797.1 3-hydroxyisobutyrate dehydrogenase [Aliiruegeria lutimaris]
MTQLGPVAVAGCGRKGGPMLAALRAAGFDAQGYDIAPENVVDDVPVTDDPTRVADELRILVTVVRDEAQTDDVLFGHGGLAERARNLETLVISSTLSPRYVRALAERMHASVRLVDAPMSGARIAAQERRLSFMLGGESAELDRLQPLFDAMGAHFYRMGPFGSGAQAKVLNNLLAASHTAMTRLVLDWADATGLDERRLLALIETSSGQNWLASGMDTIEFARDGWAEDNSIGILVKDVSAALDAAPPSADTRLPEEIRKAIRALQPRHQS